MKSEQLAQEIVSWVKGQGPIAPDLMLEMGVQALIERAYPEKENSDDSEN